MIQNEIKPHIQNNNEYFYTLTIIPSLKLALFGSQAVIERCGKETM